MTASSSSAIQSAPVRRKRKKSARRAGQAAGQSSTSVLDRPSGVLEETIVATPKRRAAVKETWRIAPGGNRSRLYLATKRALDVFGATAILTLLSPLLLAVTAVLLVTTRGRPIFVQDRVGHLGRSFRLYKFRTMIVDAERLRDTVENQQEGPVFKNDVDPRITRFGRILRRTSVDEIPQLLNILKGDMSLTGPRPPIAEEVAKYEPWQRKRLSVKPGLTCLWQVSGRSEIAFYRWMLMDLWYVRHQNLATDVMLLLRTPWAVLSRRGAY
ncbi:MAG TPA: sugar transferase [Thermoguttaceae bacterium]|nr:sugar transferase [Thermoguttaceae bacterium]